MLMYRRFISFALTVTMVAGMLPSRVAAAELETVPEETVAETAAPAETTAPAETMETEPEPEQTETVFAETEETVPAEAVGEPVPTEPEEVYEEIAEVVIPDAELPESGELYDAYLERLFYGNQVAFFGTGARERLTEVEQKFYDYLKAEILKIAAGQRTSTRIEIKKDVLVQWGMTVSFDVSAGSTTNEKATIVHNGVLDQVNRRNIINALMYDCPYEMYWYDKTVGTLINSGCSLSGTTGTITRVMFNFRVVGDMKPNGYAANNPTIDTSSVTTAQAAAQRAREIAAQYEPYGDYEKLVAFKDEICGLTSYDYASASHTQYTTDADPWQLIYVFDGDSNTKVVCEGYAKAFQYLFDLSTFQGNVESRIVVGALNGGGHMWNVVAINGKNYMADVTNSDAGTAGSGGELFLAGTAGSVQGGYTFLGHRFTYTENTIALWGEENLRLEETSFVPCDHVEAIDEGFAPDCENSGLTEGKHCTVCGDILKRQKVIPALGHSFDNGYCTVCEGQEPAVDTDGDGALEIGNAGQLYWFADKVNGGEKTLKAELVADIVVNESLEGQENLRIWTPIGSEETPYRGSFDGQGHSITGLFLDGNVNGIGLFAYLEKATVSNTTILNSRFYGNSVVGGIAGYNNGGTISGCITDMSCSGFSVVGGIVGRNNNGTIENCEVRGGTGANHEFGSIAGGIAGENVGEDGGNARIRNCVNNGGIGGHGDVGGIAGRNTGNATIENCTNTGKAWTSGIQTGRGYNAGGIAGYNGEGATISRCSNAGYVDGEYTNGGITGQNAGKITYCCNTGTVEGMQIYSMIPESGGIAGRNSGTIENCYSAAIVLAEGGYAGGLVGYTSGGKVTNSYFDGPVSQTMDDHLPYWKTTEQFASGEVAWLLNGSVTDETAVWHQNIGTDTYPSFSGGTVYRNQTGGCLEENYTYGYENAPAEPVISHSHESVVTAPTCTAGGFTTYTCVCGDTYEADHTDPLPHREAILEAVAPTCEETGLTEGKICPDCQTILLDQETVPATGHAFVLRICQNCGLVIDADHRLYAGKSMTLKATNPETGKAYTSKEVTWSLAETFAPFATVTAAGKVTARKVPERVRVEVLGTVLATGETISVLIDMIPVVTQVELLFQGEAAANNETVRMDIGEESRTIDLGIYPADTLAEIKWSVSDKKNQYAEYTMADDRLTITNPTGKSGTVTVTATVDAGVRKTVTLKVTFGSFAKTVEIAQPDKTALRSGESLTLTAAITDPETVSKPGITWTSSNKNVAAVSATGRVTARSVPHPTVVTVTATSKDGLASDALELTVLPKEEGKLVLSDGETMVTGTTLRKNPGDSFQLSAMTVTQGIPLGEPVVWSSSKNTVATVSETGVITCVGIGTAKLTATAFDGRRAEVTVKVSILAQSLTLRTKDGKNLMEEEGVTLAWVASGKSLNLAAEILPTRAAKSLQWQVTEGAEYAKIANGKLTASKNLTSPRYVTVLASTRDGSGVSGSFRVKILPQATGVQVFEMGMGVRSNTTYVVDLTANPVIRLSTRVYPAEAHQGAELTSSNKKIAAFDENGDLICFKTGTVTITAKALDGSGQKTTFTLKVVKKVRSLTLKEGADLTVVGGKPLKLAQLVQIDPGDATNKKLTWSVAPNDQGIKVSASGLLTTKKVTEPVTVNIMVTTQDDSGCMLSIDVTVKPA